MATPIQPTRKAVRPWVTRLPRDEENPLETERYWWLVRTPTQFSHRLTPSAGHGALPPSSRSRVQWSSVTVDNDALSGATSSHRGSSSYDSVRRSNSVESTAGSSIEPAEKNSMKLLIRVGSTIKGLQKASTYIRAPAVACIVFVGAFATALLVKSAFGAVSDEEGADLASDPPLRLQLPSKPLQPDDSGPGVRFAHRLYNATVRRRRFVPTRAATIFGMDEPSETNGEKSWLRDTILWDTPSSRASGTRNRGRAFSENGHTSVTTTRSGLSGKTFVATTISHPGTTATASESTSGSAATLPTGRIFASSTGSHPDSTNVGLESTTESMGRISSTDSYPGNTTHTKSTAGVSPTVSVDRHLVSSTGSYRGRIIIDSDSTSSSAATWSTGRIFISSTISYPGSRTIGPDSISGQTVTAQNTQSIKKFTVEYSTEKTATGSHLAHSTSTSFAVKSTGQSSTGSEAADSSTAPSGAASSTAPQAAFVADRRANGSGLAELTPDTRGNYSAFETAAASMAVREVDARFGVSAESKRSSLVEDVAKNGTATLLRARRQYHHNDGVI
ncbi:uncharacterized protein [Dermacentor albipictus]|uniref:uncharacterized protein n=1 Tax=Dermacentor albipictus TaxID=60249 RepID=UPI0031FBCB98